jgi:hypothetical protein
MVFDDIFSNFATNDACRCPIQTLDIVGVSVENLVKRSAFKMPHVNQHYLAERFDASG